MEMDLRDYWSSPDGLYEFSEIDIEFTSNLPANSKDYRLIVFSNVESWKDHLNALKNDQFQGVLVFIGEISELSSIYQHVINHFDRIIACKVDTKKHHSHRFLLVLNFTNEKRCYREIRERYTFCPSCGQTSKDYGGKKHHYPGDGTWIRDVWNKFSLSDPLIEDQLFLNALSQLYLKEAVEKILIIDNQPLMESKEKSKIAPYEKHNASTKEYEPFTKFNQRLILGDSLDVLDWLNSENEKFDLIFVDPPYNLGKKYDNYNDTIKLDEYTKWCVEWIKKAYFLLEEYGIFVILNTPMNILQQLPMVLEYYHLVEDIVWDDLAVPITGRMQATNYSLIFLSKSELGFDLNSLYEIRDPIYCKRQRCINDQKAMIQGVSIWSDIHRTRQKSRRWGHPCNLPEELIVRIIKIVQTIRHKNDIKVLDFFNGVGTSTMASLLCGSESLGIELSEDYFTTSVYRLENKFFTNPDVEKKKKNGKRTKRVIQQMVAEYLEKYDRINKGYSTKEQIDWLLENNFITPNDLELFVRPGELLKAVGKAGVLKYNHGIQSRLTSYSQDD